jgi:hypothetical protein
MWGIFGAPLLHGQGKPEELFYIGVNDTIDHEDRRVPFQNMICIAVPAAGRTPKRRLQSYDCSKFGSIGLTSP